MRIEPSSKRTNMQLIIATNSIQEFPCPGPHSCVVPIVKFVFVALDYLRGLIIVYHTNITAIFGLTSIFANVGMVLQSKNPKQRKQQYTIGIVLHTAGSDERLEC